MSDREIIVKAKCEHDLQSHYRPDIDGLRAIAILSVIIFHAFPEIVSGGFVGVDVFFVISGFLISRIIFCKLYGNNFNFTEFYIHRIKRIFPALILVLSVSLAFGWFSLMPSEYMQLGKHIAGGASFVQNIILWNEAGYFDAISESKPLMHLWSLAIEEQFYIIFPILAYGAWHFRLNVLLLVLVIILLSFIGNINEIGQSPVKVFFSPQTRFWEIMIGSVLAYIHIFKRQAVMEILAQLIFQKIYYKFSPSLDNQEVSLNNVISVIGFFLLSISVFTFSKGMPFPGWWALPPVIGAFLIILAGPKTWVNRKILSHKWMVSVGLISYPLYLWHWPILSFLKVIESDTPSIEARIIALAMSFILAWATYKFIERPVRFGHDSWIKTATLTALIIIIGYMGYEVFKQEGLKFRSTIKLDQLVNEQFVGANWSYMNNDDCLDNYPFEESKSYPYWFCMLSKDSSPTILLLGNSFSNQLYPGLIKEKSFQKEVILSIGVCDAVHDGNLDPWGPCYQSKQVRQKKFINKIIADTKSLKYVIISGLPENPSLDYILGLRERIEFIEEQGAVVVVFNPHLRPGFDPKGCFARPFSKVKRNCLFSPEKREILNSNFHPLIISLKKSNPNVLFFDQNEIFCSRNMCSYIKEGMPLHRDSGHISEFASIGIAVYFSEWAKSNGLDIAE